MLNRAVHMAAALKATGTDRGKTLSAKMVADALSLVVVPEQFLPLFDEFLDEGLFPSDAKAVVEAAKALGIPEEHVLERLNRPLDQLKTLILGDMDDIARYRRLAEKIDDIPADVLQELAQRAFDTNNLAGMAVLLAVALGDASQLVPGDFAAQAFGHKGIGGGTNLLKQWFDDRDRLDSGLRDKIKEIARNALIGLGLEWAAKTGGDAEQGLVPQNRARPMSASDDLDQLDLESTLEAIIGAGKSLDAVTEEDLWVYDTAKGRAVMGILIDISGSMGGRELAVCAIAVVMLLARLSPEEVAIALFESDTHVVKGFGDARDLDEVADQLLELRATGGTRVDAALRWVGDQLEEVTDADFKLLFLLSDFCFFEDQKDLRQHADRLAAMGVRYLGASHGYVCKGCSELLLDVLGGLALKLEDLDRLPALLHDAMVQLGDRGTV